jgi:TPR repeat protein
VAAAQVRLAYLCLSGEGVPRDPETGAAWLQRAAEAGDPEAQAPLGAPHARADSTAQDSAPRENWSAELLKLAIPPPETDPPELFLSRPSRQS